MHAQLCPSWVWKTPATSHTFSFLSYTAVFHSFTEMSSTYPTVLPSSARAPGPCLSLCLSGSCPPLWLCAPTSGHTSALVRFRILQLASCAQHTASPAWSEHRSGQRSVHRSFSWLNSAPVDIWILVVHSSIDGHLSCFHLWDDDCR